MDEYEDLGDGFWFDPESGGVFDDITGEWTFDDVAGYVGFDDPAAYDYSEIGLEDLGDGFWYDPESGAVYDVETQEWTQEGLGGDGSEEFTDNADGGFTDFAGNTFYADGSIEFPDGSRLDPEGNFIFADGSGVLQQDGDFVDSGGDTWERMDWAGAPNVWQNLRTGDVWNNLDGTIVESVESGYADTAGTVVGTSPKPTSNPGGGGGSSGGGSGGGLSPSAPKSSTPSLSDINNLLKTLVTAQQAYTVAKSGGASAAQLATLKQQAALAAQNVQQAQAGGSFGLPKEAIWIAGGVAALLLLTSLNRPAPVMIAAPQTA